MNRVIGPDDADEQQGDGEDRVADAVHDDSPCGASREAARGECLTTKVV